MAEISPDTERKIQELQLVEQSLQNLLMQKQQFQAQLMEIETALKELEKTKEVYKIIGNVMVLTEKDKLKEDLQRKKEILGIRVKNIEKQETSIKEKAKKTREEVVKQIKG